MEGKKRCGERKKLVGFRVELCRNQFEQKLRLKIAWNRKDLPLFFFIFHETNISHLWKAEKSSPTMRAERRSLSSQEGTSFVSAVGSPTVFKATVQGKVARCAPRADRRRWRCGGFFDFSVFFCWKKRVILTGIIRWDSLLGNQTWCKSILILRDFHF